MGGKWAGLCGTLHRRRVFEPAQLEEGNLRRCLTVWDLTALGVGSTLGVGVYVLVGSVALHLAGPAIVLSFLIAAVASLFAGMCYAEFGSRVPKAGSAYIYTYVTMGEFIAFIIGWNMILEALFGTASVARGLSMYVDSMVNKSMSAAFEAIAPITAQPFSPYFDFFAFAVVIVLGVLLATGVRASATVNNAFALVNMAVILFIIVAGAFKANVSNWNIPSSEVPENFGSGGFLPYGVWGVLKGAAVCFYGFVGFDTISSTAEEVKDPRRVIPMSILSVLVVVFIAYASVATVVTMMVPYYMQDVVASVASAFSHVGWDWARWVVSVGAVFGISASLFGAMFPLPRLLYSMSSDGLLLHWLGKVRSGNKSPVIATLVPAVLIAILAAILELQELVMMMCVGTLLSYTIVAACVILLRYRSDSSSTPERNFLKTVFGCGEKTPTKTTSNIIKLILVLFVCVCVSTALIVTHIERPLIPTAIMHCAGLLLVFVMALQPQNKEELSFKTPLVPLIPCLSIYVNIHLMILISMQTWIRVLIWIAIGIPVYIICVCCYKRKEEIEADEVDPHANKNGKPPVQIFVESPTPPGTIKHSDNGGDQSTAQKENTLVIQENVKKIPFIMEEIIIQHAYIEDNGEKEAKIIDLLDQVIQAEEDAYGEIISLKEHTEEDEVPIAHEPHRKSLSELSDAGSDASMGNQVLSKYDVIAQVHREDLPRLDEEEEKSDKPTENTDMDNFDIDDPESNNIIITQNADVEQNEDTNESDTNSRTDESGYSDTLDKTPLNEPFEEKETFHIPVPPPLDENFFTSPTFKKSYTISARPTKLRSIEQEEESKPRESLQSNGSCDDGPMIFGSDKQLHFMSKLNNIFQNKMSSENENGDEKRTRSHSTGNVVENTELAVLNRDRPQLFYDLKKEITSKEIAQNLKPVNIEEKASETEPEEDNVSLNRDDLRSKLENIFASGGPQPLKSRLMKSNPPTPEEAYQTDTSSTESITKMPKMEKNDTLKRQKAKFGEVLNSFRLTLKDDQV